MASWSSATFSNICVSYVLTIQYSSAPVQLLTWRMLPVSISLTLAIPFVLLALRINDVKQATHGAHRGLRRALVSPRLVPLMGYITLGLLVVVIPSVVWTSRLATTAKVAITVCLAISVLLVAIAIGLQRVVSVAREPMPVSSGYSSAPIMQWIHGVDGRG